MDRRDALKALGAGLVAGYGLPSPAWARFRRAMAAGQYTWAFFSAAEVETMRVLADLVIPRDERSGSATEAGCVEYADFVLNESGDRTKTTWHDGLAWLDAESARRFGGARFKDATTEQRSQLLDTIAYPARVGDDLRQTADWFTRVRDLVGSGFFSSRAGVEDLGYQGGVFSPEWRGAPDEALRDLGVSYAEWDRKYGGERGERREER
jgi:gluconate 2-dehydrogenase subunit 3-like protein